MQESNNIANAKVGDKVRCIEDWGVEHHLTMGTIYTVKRFLPDGLHLELEEIEGMIWWSLTRFELIKEEPMKESNEVVSAKVINKFNPQPGDKIICNNGEEFICCTLEFLHETISANVRPSEPVLGYNEKHSEWQDWEFSGQAAGGGREYNIREVIPQSSEATSDKKEEVKEEPRYAVEEVLEAIHLVTPNEAPWNWVPEIKENLNKVKDPQYLEYLRLKAIYE